MRVAFLIAVVLIAAALVAFAIFGHHANEHPIEPVATSTKPSTTTVAVATHPSEKPAASYMDVVLKNDPDFPTSQPLAIPLPLTECARLKLDDPLYVDRLGELWITRADARPLPVVLKSVRDESVHVVRESVVFVHRQLDDTGVWQPQIVARQPDGSDDLIGADIRISLGKDPTAQWDRAVEWSTVDTQGIILPTDDGVTIIRPRGLPVVSHYSFHVAGECKPVTLLDARGLLAWVPYDDSLPGSGAVARFVDNSWHPLEPEHGWPARVLQLVPLLDGTVLQLVVGEDSHILLLYNQLDTVPIDPKTVMPIIDRLSDKDAQVRADASAELSRYGPGLWPILQKVKDDQPPEGQSRIEQLLANHTRPKLGLMELLPGPAKTLGRFSDGGALIHLEAGVSVAGADSSVPPTITAPADLLFAPGRPMTLANDFLTRDLAADATISHFGDEWIVTDAAHGPQRLLGNHFEPLLRKKERDFSQFVAIDRQSRWLFRKPAIATQTTQPTLVLDPTLPDPSPKLAAWFDPVPADKTGWDDDGWPVVAKKDNAWALHEDDWSPMTPANQAAKPFHETPDQPTTAPANAPLLEFNGNQYFGGITDLTLKRTDGSSKHWNLPPEAVGTEPVFLVQTRDSHLYLFNQPGRVVRLLERPLGSNEPFKLEAIFTRQVPNDPLIRAWLDPAGRIDLLTNPVHLTVLFPTGQIPQPIAEKMPAEQVNADREP